MCVRQRGNYANSSTQHPHIFFWFSAPLMQVQSLTSSALRPPHLQGSSLAEAARESRTCPAWPRPSCVCFSIEKETIYYRSSSYFFIYIFYIYEFRQTDKERSFLYTNHKRSDNCVELTLSQEMSFWASVSFFFIYYVSQETTATLFWLFLAFGSDRASSLPLYLSQFGGARHEIGLCWFSFSPLLRLDPPRPWTPPFLCLAVVWSRRCPGLTWGVLDHVITTGWAKVKLDRFRNHRESESDSRTPWCFHWNCSSWANNRVWSDSLMERLSLLHHWFFSLSFFFLRQPRTGSLGTEPTVHWCLTLDETIWVMCLMWCLNKRFGTVFTFQWKLQELCVFDLIRCADDSGWVWLDLKRKSQWQESFHFTSFCLFWSGQLSSLWREEADTWS